MKKVILCAISGVLVACSSPTQQSSVPLDMQTVQDYQQRVMSAKTNTKGEHWELDKSDKRPKVVVLERRKPRIYPSMHYGYGWGRHYSGVGLNVGGF